MYSQITDRTQYYNPFTTVLGPERPRKEIKRSAVLLVRKRFPFLQKLFPLDSRGSIFHWLYFQRYQNRTIVWVDYFLALLLTKVITWLITGAFPGDQENEKYCAFLFQIQLLRAAKQIIVMRFYINAELRILSHSLLWLNPDDDISAICCINCIMHYVIVANCYSFNGEIFRIFYPLICYYALLHFRYYMYEF